MTKKVLIIILILFLFSCQKGDKEIEDPGFILTIRSPEKTVVVTEETLFDLFLHDIELKDRYGRTEVRQGYRLIDFFPDRFSQDVHGLSVDNGTTEVHFSLDLDDLYLLPIETDDETVHEIGRLQDDRFENLIRHPKSITIKDSDQDTIHYISYSSVAGRYDHHTALRAVQGIINREQPRLMTVSTGNPYFQDSDKAWMYHIESLGYQLVELSSLEEVIYTYKDLFQGMIVFKDRFKSYNNWVSAESDFALMMASLTNYVPVPFGLENTIAELAGLDIVDTFTLQGNTVLGNISDYLDDQEIDRAHDVYAHVFDTFKKAFNTKAYMSLTSEVMDYAASERLMFFDLKATQSAEDNILSQRINAYFDEHNDYFEVIGWVDHESSALDFISSYGGVIDVVGNGNLSFLKGLSPTTPTFEQVARDTVNERDPNKTYVTFFASESDTIKVGAAFQHGAWLDENRGRVPINWGLIADMSASFPFIFDYYYQSATQNDYFYSGGGSAVGFVDIDEDMSRASRDAIAAANKHYLDLADQTIIDLYNDRYTPSDPFDKDILGNYLNHSNVHAAFGRFHDGDTRTRIETWRQVPVYNRFKNFYPRRGSTDHFTLSRLDRRDAGYYSQSERSDYWFIETTVKGRDEASFILFHQENKDGYHLTIEQGFITLSLVEKGRERILFEQTYYEETKNIKVSIDKSSPLDSYVRIKLTINDLPIIDLYDFDNTFTSGGYALSSSSGVLETFKNLNGTRYSQAQAIYRRIIHDSYRFIVAYYGFVGTDRYHLSMYRSEPGIGGVISLSPTDFLKIKMMLEENHPDAYEIVNAKTFIDFANSYQQYYGTLE
jgi:hypothetical protein